MHILHTYMYLFDALCNYTALFSYFIITYFLTIRQFLFSFSTFIFSSTQVNKGTSKLGANDLLEFESVDLWKERVRLLLHGAVMTRLGEKDARGNGVVIRDD
jgi:hypothetical protein